MADLLDIAPSTSTATVAIGEQSIDVRAFGGDAIASIISRFPDLGLVLVGGIRENIGPRLIAQFGEAIGPMIAAGCGHLKDERYEKRASELPVEDQLKLLNAILRLSFPNGLVPFIQSVMTLLTGGEGGEKEKPVKLRSRKSPSASPPSSGEDSRPIMQ